MIDLNRKLGALVTYGELVEERIPTSVNRFRFNGEDGKIVERLRCAFLPRAINIRRGRREAGPDRAAARVAESELCEDRTTGHERTRFLGRRHDIECHGLVWFAHGMPRSLYI
ncbi:hypothetical protein V1477_014042 [Vespula maculifrons]|uniref:Uncharacterized protein n=1 Tax=Vespula maculifrons TaxID=7453 RepID=A0ABD2BMN2_VESMC